MKPNTLVQRAVCAIIDLSLQGTENSTQTKNNGQIIKSLYDSGKEEKEETLQSCKP